MNNQTGNIDTLIDGLRARATDPERRVDRRPTAFDNRVRTLNLGELAAEIRRAGNDLGRIVAASRSANVDPELVSRADKIAEEMATPSTSGLPSPAGEALLNATEAALGFPLPGVLRRIYGGVADGGFGPSTGLLSVARLAALYIELREGGSLPRGRNWPERLLPLVQDGAVIFGMEAMSPGGRVLAWDPEGLSEYAGPAAWSRSFSEVAPSIEAWLQQWLDGPTPEEEFEARFGEEMIASQIATARQSRALIAAMSPEERAAMGLPAVGWEQIVWGGLGLEEA